jgi:hypothetical protein
MVGRGITALTEQILIATRPQFKLRTKRCSNAEQSIESARVLNAAFVWLYTVFATTAETGMTAGSAVVGMNSIDCIFVANVAICMRATKLIIGAMLPVPQNWRDIEASVKEIQADPAAYHIGAKFLSGNPRKIAAEVTEADKENISGWIHASQPGGTLARANTVAQQTAYDHLHTCR